jgi:hypothetical protein
LSKIFTATIQVLGFIKVEVRAADEDAARHRIENQSYNGNSIESGRFEAYEAQPVSEEDAIA